MKPFTTIAVSVFALMALVQLIRLSESWEIIVNGVTIPLWVSGIACVIAAGLAVMLAREAHG
jgi:hypothetical protein